jgi:hypothetical protein
VKSNTAPCHFVSTGYTDNSLDYSVVKVLYTNISALTKALWYSFKEQPLATVGGSGLLLGVISVTGDVPN